ncbi:MAG: hypothetical protein QXR30_03740 [Candidatus Woesearchaeota archaeon]
MKIKEILKEERKKRLSIEYLDSLSNRDDVYIHFSNIEKLGINPVQFYSSTPAGIYAYPLKSSWKKYRKDLTLYPYAKERDFIYLIFVKPNIRKMIASEPISEETKRRLQDYFEKKFDNDYYIKKDIIYTDYKENLSDYFEKFWKSSSYTNGNLIRKISETFEKLNLKPSHMNYFYRKILGFDMVFDDDTGNIHMSEPLQVAILNPKIIEKYEIYENPKKQESLLVDIIDITSDNEITVNYHNFFEKIIFKFLKENSRLKDYILMYIRGYILQKDLKTTDTHMLMKYKKNIENLLNKSTAEDKIITMFKYRTNDFFNHMLENGLNSIFYSEFGVKNLLLSIMKKFDEIKALNNFFSYLNYENKEKTILFVFLKNYCENVDTELIKTIMNFLNNDKIKSFIEEEKNSLKIKAYDANNFACMIKNFYFINSTLALKLLEYYLNIFTNMEDEIKKEYMIILEELFKNLKNFSKYGDLARFFVLNIHKEKIEKNDEFSKKIGLSFEEINNLFRIIKNKLSTTNINY